MKGRPALWGRHETREVRDHRGVVGLRVEDVGGEGDRLVVQQLVVDLGRAVRGEEPARDEDLVDQLACPW
jgi:hypothetical protein